MVLTPRGRRACIPLAAAVLAAALALVGCSAATTSGHGRVAGSGESSASAAPAPAVPAAKFTDCADEFNLGAAGITGNLRDKLSIGCADVQVPLDYSQPNGRMISIALVRLHDRDNTHSLGSLLMNPGGPGASGVNFAVGIASTLPSTLLTHFDIIGFDPRGVGESSPITCLTDAQKDQLNAASPDVLTAAGFNQAKQQADEVANSCEQKYGSALADYNTVSTARDMDRIRIAVGDAQLNYLGFSYGTELGSIYAHLFPSKVRVAVLDGAVDPYTSDITAFADQLKGFEAAFDQFAAWCTKNASCKQVGNPRQAVYAIAKKAAATPIPSTADSRTATSSIVYTGVLSALYSEQTWSTLGQALQLAQHGDSSGLFALADSYNERYSGQYTNLLEANDTIGCNDSKPGPTNTQIRATAKKWVTEFPMFGLWSAASLFSCQQWQPDRDPVPLPSAATPNKVLVIGNVHDPATPYQGAKDLVKAMGNAVLLSWDGQGHTSYLQGSDCIDNYVNNYLVTLALPPANTLCPA